MTDPQRKIMLHALGLDNAKIAYRNRYVASPGHASWEDLQILVAAGMMRDCGNFDQNSSKRWFDVTEDGEAALYE